MARVGVRDAVQKSERDEVLIPRSAEVGLRMLQGPGESEPTPQVFVCPTCGDDTRLVMVTVGSRQRSSKKGHANQGERYRGVNLLLHLRRRQVEQILAEFKGPT